MDMGFIGTLMGTVMKGNGKMTNNLEMEPIISPTEVNTKDYGNQALPMAKEFSFMIEVKDLMLKCTLEVGC